MKRKKKEEGETDGRKGVRKEGEEGKGWEKE